MTCGYIIMHVTIGYGIIMYVQEHVTGNIPPFMHKEFQGSLKLVYE